ncbi:ARID DNA-binding domain-containing protein [Artemisia annua]|uniref:ARID DNA-binding domain-containing protein n=1 Tax=Artemisia annua TaxID=35608 RepID=A0A2U1M3U7_ARTAN|nr:ARID DNA-binding domain-containing protein [Artemisia annua]
MKRSRCYICFTRGHAYWNCPRNKHDETVKSYINWEVIGTAWDNIWYVSDEYPRHMNPNLDVFEKFKAEIVGTSATGEAGLNVQGIGEVLLPTEVRNFVIPGVFYVPNASLNTLSLSQLMQQGFEVVFKDTKCTVKRLFDMDNKSAIGTPSYDPVYERMVHCWTCNDYHLSYMCPLKKDLTDNQTFFKERSGESNNNAENVGCMEEKQSLDAVRGKAIEAIMQFCDSLYFRENTIEESMNGIQGPRVPSKNEFESLIGFIEMVSEQEIVDECKELVKDHFERMVHWFHKDYMEDEERPIPARINGVKVNLLDLYLTVKGLGGHTQVVIGNKWIEVAYAMGFPKEYASELQKCYGMHLSLLEAYYEVARSYVPRAREREGTSEETRQGHIGTEARLVDDEERMIGKVELNDGSAINRRIKIEDDGYEVKFRNF